MSDSTSAVVAKFNELKELINETDVDVVSFGKGNAAAGGRIRAAIQTAKGLGQEIRVGVLAVRNEKKEAKAAAKAAPAKKAPAKAAAKGKAGK